MWRRDSAVAIVTGYRLDGRGVGFRVPVKARFLSSPRRSDRFWGPPSLRGVKLTIHLQRGQEYVDLHGDSKLLSGFP
jgi:hypothetical protein